MLMRHSGQEDIILGCPFANRSRGELDRLVGLFVNTLPIRLNLQGNPISAGFSSASPLDNAGRICLAVGAIRSPGFRDLATARYSRTPIYQVLSTFAMSPGVRLSLKDWICRPLGGIDATQRVRPFPGFRRRGRWKVLDASSNTTPTFMMRTASSTLFPLSKHAGRIGDKKPTGPWQSWRCLLPRRVKRMLLDWNETTL